MTSPIIWFKDLTRADIASVGGKGANLGELVGAGFPVPPGFVVTAAGYTAAMDEAGVRADLMARFTEACAAAEDPTALASAAEELQAMVAGAGVPDALRADVLEAYHRLGSDLAVAVRSSATAEDTAGTSFAGMHETYANVVGDDAVIDRIVDCWASLYGQRVISYRAAQGLTEEPSIAVVVQQLIASERSGVLFTADPSTGNRDHVVIEGAFGLGEVVVGGQVEPDTYVLDKDGPRLTQTRIGHKGHGLFADSHGGIERVEATVEDARRRVLTDDEAVALARMGLEVEAHYGGPKPPPRPGARCCSRAWRRRPGRPAAGSVSSGPLPRATSSRPARSSSRP
jgi:pyruvate,water dikinase